MKGLIMGTKTTVTDPPNINFPTWSTGGKTEVSPFGGSQARRVTTNDDIRVDDINDLRRMVEGLAVHRHSYVDDMGSC